MIFLADNQRSMRTPTAHNMISRLDLLRSRMLKATLKVSFCREIFQSRSKRIFFMGLTAMSIYFVVSLFFPIWVLFLGPIVWGVPHLISSLRYNTNTPFSKRKKLVLFQSFIWLAVFAYRITVDIFQIPIFFSDIPLLFEVICLAVAFLFQVIINRRVNIQIFFYFTLFATLLFLTYRYPIQTALFLLIGHNYVPLFSWFKSCQDRQDIRTFFLLSALYFLLSLILLLGLLEPFYSYFSPVKNVTFLKWEYTDIANSLGASPSDYPFWFRIVSLYAFSQAIHYFLWIKAIPENFLPQQFPPSFKWSLQKLKNDFGSGSVLILIGLMVTGTAYWLFFEFQSARLFYFSVASYHGFLELSALPFLTSNRLRK